MLKISIITVTYNSARTLSDCLESVASQSYQAHEHVVVDGASNDETLAILQRYKPQLAIVLSEPDGGIYHAMNKGIQLVSGDVIGFLNSDDFYAHSHVLSSVAKIFEEHPLLDACFADLIYVEQLNTSRTVRYWQSSDFASGAFSRGWCPPHPTFFVRSSVYERFGFFDLNFRIASDVELMMRFLEVHKIRVRYVSEVWVKMRLGGTTNKNLKNIWLQNREVLRALVSNGLPADPKRFFGYKLVSRGKQFFQRPRA